MKAFLALSVFFVILLVGCTSSPEIDITIQKEEAPQPGTKVGDLAPDVTLRDVEGNPISITDYKGEKHLVLNFWASWCPPCREEMPAFESLYQENKEGLAVVGINLQEDLEAIKPFLTENGITFPILLDPTADAKRLYNVITQPVTYFINKEGVIVDKKLGPLTLEEINDKVKKLLEGKSKQVKIASKDEILTLSDGTPYIIHPNKFLSGGPPKDGIPSIDNPRFLPNEEIDWLPDDDLGLGIEHKGEARFYPFRILVSHEIVNDEIQGDPILITYCPLCFTGIGFVRELDGEPVEFGVSGKLYNSELVMYDRKTDSYWPQSLGKAVLGPSTGKTIQKIPTDTVLYGDWISVHPDSLVLSKNTGFFRQYNGRNPYGTGRLDEELRLQFPLENTDGRLGEYDVVYGVEVNGAFKAYAKKDLPFNAPIEDEVGGEAIIVDWDDNLKSPRIKKTNGELLVHETLFWFAWAAFHPETELYIP